MGILFSALLNAEQYDSLTDTRLESDKNHNSVVLVKDKKKKNNSASYKENFLEALNKADYDEVITEISEKGVLNREAGIPSHSLMAKPGDIPRIQLYKKVKYKDKLGITLSKIKERKKIPRLDIGREEKISSRNFSVKGLLIGNLKLIENIK